MDIKWLLGFIEGEGSFMINKSIIKNKYLIIQPTFKISLHANDKEVIYKIQEFLKMGNINFKRPQRIGSSHQYEFSIRNINDCMKLRDLLINEDFHTKKRLDFLKWSSILDMIHNKEHYNPSVKQDILNIVKTMNLRGIGSEK